MSEIEPPFICDSSEEDGETQNDQIRSKKSCEVEQYINNIE